MNAPEFLTSNAEMQDLLRIAEKAASKDIHILITGESGTGKNILAEYIHFKSERCSNPFIEISCANLPTELMESELFGYEKGAFTGATESKKGRFEEADGGTVLIDEIAELPIALQSKLLRFLQDKMFERIGGTKTTKVNVRIIATTKADLDDLVQQEKFREDLYYRINVLNIHLPRLQERREDILLLSHYFLKLLRQKNDLPGLKLSQEAEQLLLRYHWPGNVRELRNVIENSAIMSDGKRIQRKDLNFPFSLNEKEIIHQLAQEKLPLSEIEKLYIEEILQLTGNNRSQAARILGINRKTLLEKRKKYGLLKDDED